MMISYIYTTPKFAKITFTCPS